MTKILLSVSSIQYEFNFVQFKFAHTCHVKAHFACFGTFSNVYRITDNVSLTNI